MSVPAVAGSYPVRSGNYVVPLIDGEAAFTRICEAVEAARKSLWVTVAFLHDDFRMPGGRGSFFDVLDRAVDRGLDVRVIFWRTDRPAEHFHGAEADHAFLAARKSRFRARWDRAQKHYCQHQKSWLIDAGAPGEIAFVGGINLNPASVSAPVHAGRDGAHTHDVYCELRGPCATDVHHNFAQRWNEAGERAANGGHWGHTGDDDLAFPTAVSASAGAVTAQMQRTVRAGHYTDGRATPGGAPFDIAQGEHSVFDQYVAAIEAARSAIYIEDQYLASPEILECLHRALARGVEIAFLCPANPEEQVKQSRRDPRSEAFFKRLGALGTHPNFVLAGIASPRTGEPVYVHDKIMIVDDEFATIGSCNIATQSFFNDTELNAAIWDKDFARAFRSALYAEHLLTDTSRMEARDALKLFAQAARANAQARHRGEAMNGIVFALDPARYAG
ncbi:MAG TPA: phosphatidylserine/phosphatidylglycerophosphate/cardiolipin synthase family protein [Rhizomicrobium sp.]